MGEGWGIGGDLWGEGLGNCCKIVVRLAGWGRIYGWMSLMDVTISESKPAREFRGDGELLAAFVEKRDEGAFAEVVRRHGGMVLGVCRSVLGNTTDAEDAAQAVFLTLAQKAGSGAVRGHVVGWLHRVAWYVAARGAEARAIRLRHEKEASRMRHEEGRPEEKRPRLEELHAGLERLPEKYREALILHHVEGRSQVETAALVRCSEEAVAVRLHRGREMLRKQLARAGVVASMGFWGTTWGVSAMGETTSMFVESTSTAAGMMANGAVDSVGVSRQAMGLMKGAMDMLFWKKMRNVAVGVVLALLLGGLVGTVVIVRGANGEPAAERRVEKAAEAGGASQAVAEVVARERYVTGHISRIGAGGIAIKRQNNQVVTVGITAGTVVKVDDQVVTRAELKLEMSVAAILETGPSATEILAYSSDAKIPRR